MTTAEGARYQRLQTGADDIENVPLKEKQEAAFASRPLWRQRTSLYPLEIAVRVVLGFILVLSLLNIGFLLGDRIIGTTCDRRVPAGTSNNIIWRDNLRSLAVTKPKRFDATLYGRNQYRGPPSPEIDAAWDRFTTNPWMVETAAVLNVSRKEMYSSGNTAALETVVELDQENGGGFMGTLEVFHQLHCLNVLRKWTYWDYYVDTDPFFQTRADHRREHADGISDHCIDVLRQALMCKSDLGLILFHWVKDIQIPSPDFNTVVSNSFPSIVMKVLTEIS
ncbi:hypothetical protein AYO22_00670 [Fonsecaea multimorphosa]|nr:hypothetical protein AYO22_00670 [Fonsecaea multimorphosa]